MHSHKLSLHEVLINLKGKSSNSTVRNLVDITLTEWFKFPSPAVMHWEGHKWYNLSLTQRKRQTPKLEERQSIKCQGYTGQRNTEELAPMKEKRQMIIKCGWDPGWTPGPEKGRNWKNKRTWIRHEDLANSIVRRSISMFRYLYYSFIKYNIRGSRVEGLWELLVLFSVKLFQNKKVKNI